jgi:inner membrane protein
MDAITDLYFSQPYWIWAGLAAVLLAVEVLTGSGWLLWVAASAGVTAVVVALAGTNAPTTVLVFAVLTLISTLAVRRYLPRAASAPGHDINDNISRIVGHRGSSVSPFAGGAGRVSIDGKEWAAQLVDGDSLAAGVPVEVTDVEGSRLRVRPC